MENLIEAINKLQETFNRINTSLDLDLPSIAVVGSQSSGKSSVLESIVGHDFLPRGSGIVTRCPLILQLHHIEGKEEYAEFSHSSIRYTDFKLVRDEIIARTNSLAGGKKEISTKQIILKVYSYNVLNLTLIDLPGLTNVPIEGQSKDICEVIRNMVQDYVDNDSTLILAVTPANDDLSNSSALGLARKVDPDGDRTIGVITKLDICNSESDCMEILSGNIYPLKLGYIGVVCRSQKDINNDKSIKEALDSENKFFRQHEQFSKIKDRCGIPHLSQLLSKRLMNHIKNCLPSLKSTVADLLQERKEEMKSYGFDLMNNEDDDPKNLLLLIIAKFVEYYRDMLDGRFIKDNTKSLQGGARIYTILHKLYENTIENIEALYGMTEDEIRTILTNSKSLHPSLFISEKAIETLMHQQSSKLLKPSIDCLNLVHEELIRIITKADVPELLRFKNLAIKISELMQELLNKCSERTRKMIENLIESEKWYIDMNHPDMISVIKSTIDFIDYRKLDNKSQMEIEKEREIQRRKNEEEEKKKLQEEQEKKKKKKGIFGFFGLGKDEPEQEEVKNEAPNYVRKKGINNSLPDRMHIYTAPSSRELMEISAVKTLVEGYFRIIKKNIKDLVPKTIVSFLINESKSTAQNALVRALYLEKDIESLMSENQENVLRKKKCRAAIEALEEAKKVLNDINYKSY